MSRFNGDSRGQQFCLFLHFTNISISLIDRLLNELNLPQIDFVLLVVFDGNFQYCLESLQLAALYVNVHILPMLTFICNLH